MSQLYSTPSPDSPDRRDYLYLGSLIAIVAVIGLRGILNASYIGQDFDSHRILMLTYPGGYSYYFTNPPGLY